MQGIASRARSRLMPEVPAIAEMGLQGYEDDGIDPIGGAPAVPGAMIARELAPVARTRQSRQYQAATSFIVLSLAVSRQRIPECRN
jgi:hypothetical protein